MQITSIKDRPNQVAKEQLAQLMARVPFIMDVEEYLRVEKKILKLREVL